MAKRIQSIPRCILLGVVDPHIHREAAIENLSELELLVKTYGGFVVAKDIQHRSNPDPATYIGSGVVKQLKQVIKPNKIDIVIFNAILKSSQLFRLEKELWELQSDIQVWDKADLILHIFDQHATTKEAKLQIELAKLQHTGPRIYGLGGTYFSRQAGGIGTRGIGETNIETMQRHLKERVRKIRKELSKVAVTKKMRIEWRKLHGITTVALVGYTNAGKTTLFNKLTKKEKQVKNSLFTTLDTVIGRLASSRRDREVLISDTIGFISGLPPFLIDAFRSTLMESLHAELLLHVIDSSDSELQKKIEVVEKILKGLDEDKKAVLVFNKTDKLTRDQLEKLKTEYLDRNPYFISAKTNFGLRTLYSFLVNSTQYVNIKR